MGRTTKHKKNTLKHGTDNKTHKKKYIETWDGQKHKGGGAIGRIPKWGTAKRGRPQMGAGGHPLREDGNGEPTSDGGR